MKYISIICVSYYSKHLLKKLIRNLHDKINDEFEVIIVNNSHDEKVDFIESKNIRVVNSDKNLGYGGGINLALTHAKYQNLLIINPDIEILEFNFPNSNIPFIAGGYRPNKPFGFVFPSVAFDTFGLLFPFLKKYSRRKINCIPNGITKVDWITGSLIATTKETIFMLKGFDENYFLFFEEVDLCKRAYKKNIPIFVTSEVVYEASSAREKASSIDVKWIKVKSEMESFVKYHQVQSFGLSFYVAILKFFSFMFVFFLSLCGHKRKVKNALKYYKSLLEIKF